MAVESPDSASTGQVVFSITACGNDFYTAMTRVAIASLRLSNPGLRVVVACDRETSRATKQACDPLLGEVDDWLVVDTPPGDAVFRNRFVKTSLRENIDGPFLFLDSDIFVRGDLGEIFKLDVDIAGAANHSRDVFVEQITDHDASILTAMGWITGGEAYINGGVLFYNNTGKARQFAAEWHRRWLRSYTEHGDYRDQPALNSALHHTQPKLAVLAACFNSQFKLTPSVAGLAVLWHYNASIRDIPYTAFELLVGELQQGAGLDAAKIATMAKSPHPWRSANVIDDIAARSVMRRGRFDGWESAWLRGEFRRHAIARVRRVFRLMKRSPLAARS